MSTFAVNELEIKVYGGTLTELTSVTISDIETMDIALDSNVEEWDSIGDVFKHAMKTGAKFGLSFDGKYNTTDAGQDNLRETWDKVGTAAERTIILEYPDASSFKITGPVAIKNFGGGKSTDIGSFSFDVTSNGKPTYTPAV